jgi:hypothetical protein
MTIEDRDGNREILATPSSTFTLRLAFGFRAFIGKHEFKGKSMHEDVYLNPASGEINWV